jgi:mRNA capping enzyme, beta chain
MELEKMFPDVDPIDEKDVFDALKDPLLQSITEFVAYMRSKNSENLELEIRVGSFASDQTFHPGYSHVPLMRRMTKRLETNCSKLNSWTALPQISFLSGEYLNNIRKRVAPQQIPIIIQKRKLAKIDISSDRLMGLRVSLSEEIPVAASKLLDAQNKEQEPIQVRCIYRASFQQKIHFNNKFSVLVQYDISKVSTGAPNKLECTKTPAQYHCEVELKDKLIKLGNPDEERIQNQCIAYALLQCAKTFLGTHKMVNGEISERLNQPLLTMISSSSIK